MSWAALVKGSDEVISPKNDANVIPHGWVVRYFDKDGKMHEDSNCPDEQEYDLNQRVYDAITTMKRRWELYHHLAGTYESYEVDDDLDDYGDNDNEYSSSSDEEEQNEQLAGGHRYIDE